MSRTMKALLPAHRPMFTEICATVPQASTLPLADLAQLPQLRMRAQVISNI